MELPDLDGYKTYIAAIGMMGTGLFLAIAGKIDPGQLTTIITIGLSALGLRHALKTKAV